jgi:SSS family transporter
MFDRAHYNPSTPSERTPHPMTLPLSALVVLVAYVAGVTFVGSRLGRSRQSVEGYFLAGRAVPWWAITFCIVATETSTLTFVGVPGMAYTGDWRFLQLAFGYVVGRIVIASVLVPAYFEGALFTSYELLQKRFGGGVRTAAAAIFLLSRTLGDGIRLHAACLVLAVAAGVPEWAVILVLGLAMILYTEKGGVTATIWTDAVQMFVYLLGAFVCLIAVGGSLPQGVSAALAQAAAQGKLRVLDWSLDPTQAYTFWTGLIGGAFLTLATHGTDHYLVQRLLVARSRRDAALGLALSGPLVLLQFVVFLVLGSLLYAHFGGRPFVRGDEVLPTFAATALPGPLLGFILAAIVAAALSPSLNSMASATVRDFYLPYVRPDADESRQMRVGRACTVAFGLAQMGVAALAQDLDSALQAGLAALSYASGPTVGAFLLGVLTRSATSRGTLMGMVAGLLGSLSVGTLAAPVIGWPGVAWTWNVAVGTIITVVVGVVASRWSVRFRLPELALATTAFLISGGLAELYLRYFHPVHGMLYALHPRYLHTLVPGARRLFVHQPEDGGRALLVTVSSEGFLGSDLGPRARHTRRIAVYGDSFVAGEFSPVEERFATRLARRLSADGPVEAVNAAVVGYGPDQAALRLEDEMALLRPDLVVMAVFAGNDFGDLLRNRVFFLDPSQRLAQRTPRVSADVRTEFVLAEEQARGSMLLRGIRELLSRDGPPTPPELLPPGGYAYLLQRRRREAALATSPGNDVVEHLLGDPYDADLSLEPDSESARYKAALMEGVLGRIAEIAKKQQVPLVFLFIPSAYDIGEGFEHPDRERFPAYRPSALTDALTLAAERNGWTYLNLFPVYEAALPAHLYFRRDEHWNARGQDLAAEQVAALVRARGLLPRLAQ